MIKTKTMIKDEAVAEMLDSLKKKFPDAEVYDGDRISFTRKTKMTSYSFFLWSPVLKAGEWTWELGVQGDSTDLEVDYDLQTPEEVFVAVKRVNASWLRDND